MNPVSGVCTCPTRGFGFKGCVEPLKRDVSVLAGAPGSGSMGRCGAAWIGFRCHNVCFQVLWDTDAETEISTHGFNLEAHDHS